MNCNENNNKLCCSIIGFGSFLEKLTVCERARPIELLLFDAKIGAKPSSCFCVYEIIKMERIFQNKPSQGWLHALQARALESR